jgi:HPt (histidine-containing phosphotransfer) domain-containing protein
MIQYRDIKPGQRIVVQVDIDLEDIVPIFLGNREEDIGEIREALSCGDFEAIRILGHSMKGAGGGYGFDAITDMGATLETAAMAGDRREIEFTVGLLATYLECIAVEYV